MQFSWIIIVCLLFCVEFIRILLFYWLFFYIDVRLVIFYIVLINCVFQLV